jgi:hypothetical protein
MKWCFPYRDVPAVDVPEANPRGVYFAPETFTGGILDVNGGLVMD